MKNYKLIKEYPGSPKLGITLGYTGNEWDDNNQIKVSLVESSIFSEFWEEVIEKDYEILSIIPKNNSLFGIIFKYNCVLPLENFVTIGNYNIHSIKRLSDGEIFTIDDYVKIISSSNPCCEEGIIGHFGVWLTNIKNLEKVKQRLFTTEDGVDIFEGDKYFYFHTDFNDGLVKGIPWTIDETITNNNLSLNNEFIKRFLTKEKAEDYILMNKKSLSPNDILKVWSKLSLHTEESLMENSVLMAAIIKSIK